MAEQSTPLISYLYNEVICPATLSRFSQSIINTDSGEVFLGSRIPLHYFANWESGFAQIYQQDVPFFCVCLLGIYEIITTIKKVRIKIRMFIMHQRLENSLLTTRNSPANIQQPTTIFYSDVELPPKYSPVTLHLSPATRILHENPAKWLKVLFCHTEV